MDKKARLRDALAAAVQQSQDADRAWALAMAHDAHVDPEHTGDIRARHHLDALWQDREVAHERVRSLGNEARAVPVTRILLRLRALFSRSNR